MTVPSAFRLSLGGLERKACENSQTGVEFCAVMANLEPGQSARRILLGLVFLCDFFVAALTVEFETSARGATFFG